MLLTKRTNSQDADFVDLVKQLDIELAEIDGAESSFYAQYNKIDLINHSIVIYQNHAPVACGAIKEVAPNVMEVKRMFTIGTERGKGLATIILTELEVWAKELGYAKCVLETGKRQPDAIALYTKNAYQITPNYGQYIGVENSVCFEKLLH